MAVEASAGDGVVPAVVAVEVPAVAAVSREAAAVVSRGAVVVEGSPEVVAVGAVASAGVAGESKRGEDNHGGQKTSLVRSCGGERTYTAFIGRALLFLYQLVTVAIAHRNVSDPRGAWISKLVQSQWI